MLSEDLQDKQELKRKQQKLFQQQKKFKNLESDKKLFAEETINFIKKQKMGIDKMKKENEALKQLIAKVNTEKDLEKKQGQSYENGRAMLCEISEAIEQEKQTQKNIDMHISNFQKKIVEKKRNCTSVNTGAENEGNLQKQIKILENRLDKANQKFNETIAVNKDLKNVIDSLRKERVIFDNLYKKLESQLHEKRKKMADIIEKANNAYEDRDKANNQIQTMKEQAKKEAVEFEKSIKDMSHAMEKIKLSSYMKKVGKTYEVNGEPNFQETDVNFSVQQKHAKQTKKSSEQNEKIQKFREDFAKIEAATQIHNFDELVRIFSENEEKNFQMFKFVNLQSNEIEELEFEIAGLREEIAQDNRVGEENDKDRYLYELESKLHKMKENLSVVEESYRASQKEAKVLSGLIERIFETIDCSRDVAKEIGGSKTISETNLLIFLAIVEHKATQIVSTYKQFSKEYSKQGQAKPGAIQTNILTFEDFEDNEEYDKLLSFDQLRKKAMDFIVKQQNQKQKKKEIRPRKK